MRGHITSQEIHLAAEGALEPGSLLEISRHIKECVVCARRAEAFVDIDALAADMRAAISEDEHPSMEELIAYVDDELEATAHEWVEAHLESCARCREDVADLRAEQEKLGGGWRRWWWIAAGILVAIAVGAGTIWLKSGSSPRGPSVHNTPGARPPPSDSWRDLERSVLAAGRIDPPAILQPLRPPARPLRGVDAGVDVTLSPTGEVVEDERPLLVWTATPGATYAVMIFAGDRIVAESGPISAPQWRTPHPLQRGTNYGWQVEIRHADGSSTIAPAAPQPQAIFRIADAATLDGIAAASHAHPGDHLLLAILYARAGMQSRALAELNAHLASHPSDVRAAALADGIRGW